LQYNAGFVILDKQDPTRIIQRSDEPILSPELTWETGIGDGVLSLTPNVVFIEGWAPTNKPDQFVVFYGGADSVIGVGLLTVTIDHQLQNPIRI